MWWSATFRGGLTIISGISFRALFPWRIRRRRLDLGEDQGVQEARRRRAFTRLGDHQEPKRCHMTSPPTAYVSTGPCLAGTRHRQLPVPPADRRACPCPRDPLPILIFRYRYVLLSGVSELRVLQGQYYVQRDIERSHMRKSSNTHRFINNF